MDGMSMAEQVGGRRERGREMAVVERVVDCDGWEVREGRLR